MLEKRGFHFISVAFHFFYVFSSYRNPEQLDELLYSVLAYQESQSLCAAITWPLIIINRRCEFSIIPNVMVALGRPWFRDFPLNSLSFGCVW